MRSLEIKTKYLGNVCTPFDAAKVEEFRLGEVPTVDDLIRQLNEGGGGTKDKGEGLFFLFFKFMGSDYKRTKLRESIKIFKNCFLKPLHRSIRKESIHSIKRESESSF